MSRLVLVTGATGKQGGAVTRALLAAGHRVRALTRNPSSPAAKALVAAGAELAMGGFDDRPGLDRAVDGVDTVFAMGTPYEGGVATEIRQGKALIQAARRVPHFVYTSVASADKDTGIPHFESKRELELYIEDTGIPNTILRPVYFMSNIFFPQTLEGMRHGVLAIAVPEDRKLSQIAVEDIGAFAALVIGQPERFIGKAIDLAGDDLTGADAAEILSAASGKSLTYVEVPIEAIRSFSEDMALMYEWFDRVGYSIDIPALRRAYPEIAWQDYRTWASRQDWRTLNS